MAEDIIMSAWETSMEARDLEMRRKFDEDEDDFEDDGFTFDDEDEEEDDLDDEDELDEDEDFDEEDLEEFEDFDEEEDMR
jgi:chaperonin GroEL